MVILGNVKDNCETAKTANKSIGFDLSATQSCLYDYKYFVKILENSEIGSRKQNNLFCVCQI